MSDRSKKSSLPPTPGRKGTRSAREKLAAVVEALCEENGRPPARAARRGEPLPSRDTMIELVRLLSSALFPGYFGFTELAEGDSMRFHVGATLDRVLLLMGEQVRRGLCFTCTEHTPSACTTCEGKSLEITARFLERLPEVRRLLETDVQAAFVGDPAATCPEETVFCYPGIRALVSHRLAHELWRLGVPLLPRMINEFAHSHTGIDIHPGAEIGEACFIDHGTGVVIGETCRIGRRVRIYQGVTLGAKSFPLDEHGNPIKGIPRHPIVEDDVVIYSGATILGRVTIGRGSVIGGNVWLTRSVPPGSRVTQQAARSERFENGAGI